VEGGGGLPSGFFDEPASVAVPGAAAVMASHWSADASSAQVSQSAAAEAEEPEERNVLTEIMGFGGGSDEDDDEDEEDKEATGANGRGGGGGGQKPKAVPKGFFDNADANAKARGEKVNYKR